MKKKLSFFRDLTNLYLKKVDSLFLYRQFNPSEIDGLIDFSLFLGTIGLNKNDEKDFNEIIKRIKAGEK